MYLMKFTYGKFKVKSIAVSKNIKKNNNAILNTLNTHNSIWFSKTVCPSGPVRVKVLENNQSFCIICVNEQVKNVRKYNLTWGTWSRSL